MLSKVKISGNGNSLLNLVETEFYEVGASRRHDYFGLSISRALLFSRGDPCILSRPPLDENLL